MRWWNAAPGHPTFCFAAVDRANVPGDICGLRSRSPTAAMLCTRHSPQRSQTLRDTDGRSCSHSRSGGTPTSFLRTSSGEQRVPRDSGSSRHDDARRPQTRIARRRQKGGFPEISRAPWTPTCGNASIKMVRLAYAHEKHVHVIARPHQISQDLLPPTSPPWGTQRATLRR